METLSSLWKATWAHNSIQRTLSVFLFFSYYLIRDIGCEFRGRIHNFRLPRNLVDSDSVVGLDLLPKPVSCPTPESPLIDNSDSWKEE